MFLQGDDEVKVSLLGLAFSERHRLYAERSEVQLQRSVVSLTSVVLYYVGL